ncbi:MAG TPA: hypothetical protein VFE78_28085 [Gemmataceae bacterium]|nr:hypothetical protein [Gemmataceae bacterium]
MTALVLVLAGVTAGDGGKQMEAARGPAAVNFEACAWEGTFRTADGESGRAEWRDGVIRLHHPLGPGRVLPVLARGTAGPGNLEVGHPDDRLGRWYAACRCERSGVAVRLVAGDGPTATTWAWLTLHPAASKPHPRPVGLP